MIQEKRNDFLEAVSQYMDSYNKRVLKLTKHNRAHEFKEEIEYISFWEEEGCLKVVPGSQTTQEIRIKITARGRKLVKDEFKNI